MTSVVSEVAKNPCVPMEQNGLVANRAERVIQTGLNFAIPKLNIESLRGQTVFLIGDTDTIEAFGTVFSNERSKTWNPTWLFKVNETVSGHYTNHGITICRRTILDIPKEYRSSGIIICFDEPSYNGRQCLFHLYGVESVGISEESCAKINVKPYQAFTQLIEGTQGKAMDSAIVFVPKALQNDKLRPVMWCDAKLEVPTPIATTTPPMITQEELTIMLTLTERIQNETASLLEPDTRPFGTNILPESLKAWVESVHPTTKYVRFQQMKDDSSHYTLWGFDSPSKFDSPDAHSWTSSIIVHKSNEHVVNEKLRQQPAVEKTVPSDITTQLATLTEAVLKLTALVEAKLAT